LGDCLARRWKDNILVRVPENVTYLHVWICGRVEIKRSTYVCEWVVRHMHK
jgi:hypothetical protein